MIFIKHIYITLFITETQITKNLCNLVLSQYTPARHFLNL